VAGNPIKIRLEAETQSAERDLAGVADKLDDVSDSLKDVDRAGSDASRGLDRSMGKVEDSTKDAGRVIDKDLTDALKDAAKQSKRTGDDIGDNIKRGTRDASEGTTAMRENAASNAKEMAGSFQDVNSALDGMQGFLAEATEGFGAAGIAVGVLGGIGLGALSAGLQTAADKANELTQNAVDFAKEIGSSTLQEQASALRDRFQEMLTAINDARSVWEVWQPRAITNAEKFAEAIKAGNLNARDLMDAFTNTNPQVRLETLNRILQSTTDKMSELDVQRRQYGTGIEIFDRLTSDEVETLNDQRNALAGVKQAIQDEVNSQQAALEITRALADAQGLTVEQYTKQTQAAANAAEAQSAYQSALDSMATTSSIYDEALATNEASIQAWAAQNKVSVDEAKATWEGAPLTLDEMLNTLASKVKERTDFEANLKDLASRGFGALADELKAGGPEANAAAVDLLAHGTDAQVQQYAQDQGSLLGKNLAHGASSALAGSGASLQDGLNQAASALTPIVVKTTVDAAGLQRQIKQAIDGTFRISVNGNVLGVRYE